MVTAVLSDLHLGTRSQADILRQPTIRARLFDALADADRIVLLGDVIELREQSLPDVLAVAGPFFEELGERLPDTPLTVLSGNHDHHVVAEWLEERRLARAPLGLEERTHASSTRIGRWLSDRMPRSTIELAYPGVWLRPGTYAHHGHYIDAHMSIPRLEAIAVSAIARATGGMPDGPRIPDDYEAVIAPLYGFAYALAQASARSRRVLGMDYSRKVWKQIDSGRSLRSKALRRVAIPSAVFGLNRAGMGPFEANITPIRLRESGLEGMRELIEALQIDAREIVFGHTHRPGPLPMDASWDRNLFNTGSWLYEPNLLKSPAAEAPYWPGCVLFIEDDEPPELRRLLLDVSHEELGAERAYS